MRWSRQGPYSYKNYLEPTYTCNMVSLVHMCYSDRQADVAIRQTIGARHDLAQSQRRRGRARESG